MTSLTKKRRRKDQTLVEQVLHLAAELGISLANTDTPDNYDSYSDQQIALYPLLVRLLDTAEQQTAPKPTVKVWYQHSLALVDLTPDSLVKVLVQEHPTIVKPVYDDNGLAFLALESFSND
jgi:hypothetical protein